MNKQIQRALNTSREACLQQEQNQNESACIPLVVTIRFYSLFARLPNAISHPSRSQMITEGFFVPTDNCLLSSEKPEGPPGSSDSTSTPIEWPGGASRCKTFPILRVTGEFSSHTTGQSYKVKFRASCKSSNLVYLVTCRRCGLQYVGETSQPLHVRISGNRSDITHWRTDLSPVAEHFNSSAQSVSDMTVMVVELSTGHDPCLRNAKEDSWIRTLETLLPSRMNLRDDSL